ncbi:hypothetical protein BKA80DRAFT_268617, partial [Phyllosticta citrichinensis]
MRSNLKGTMSTLVTKDEGGACCCTLMQPFWTISKDLTAATRSMLPHIEECDVESFGRLYDCDVDL